MVSELALLKMFDEVVVEEKKILIEAKRISHRGLGWLL